jgi:hypothetical protein
MIFFPLLMFFFHPADCASGNRVLDMDACGLRHQGAEPGQRQDYLDTRHYIHALDWRADLLPRAPAGTKETIW